MNNTEKLLAAESLIKQATLKAILTGAKNFGSSAVSGLGKIRDKVTKYLGEDVMTPPDKISQDYADWIKLNPAAHPTMSRAKDLAYTTGAPLVAGTGGLWAYNKRLSQEKLNEEAELRNNPPFRSAERKTLPAQVPFRPSTEPRYPYGYNMNAQSN